MSLLILPHSQSIITSAFSSAGSNGGRMIDGTLDSLWLGTSGMPISLDFGLDGEASYVAIHDLRCTHPITEIQAQWTTTGGTVTDTFLSPVIARDSFYFVRAPITASALSLVITTGATSTLQVGQVIVGVPFAAPSPRALSVSDGPLVIENGNRRVLARPPQMIVSFDYPPHPTDLLSDFLAGLRGVTPASVVPDIDDRITCFGFLGSRQSWSGDSARMYKHQLRFEEQLRALV